MSRQRPSVRLLPNHWCASSCAISRSVSQPAVEVVGAEDRQALRLQRDLQLVVGDHDGVAVERVRPEQSGEGRRSSRGCRPNASSCGRDEPAGQQQLDRHRRPSSSAQLRSARSARWRGRSPSAPAARSTQVVALRARRLVDERAVGDDPVAGGVRDRDPVGRLVGRPVVAGNQDGAPCGWPATMTPSASSSQPGLAATSGHRRRAARRSATSTVNGRAGRDRPPRADDEPPPRWRVLGAAVPSTVTLVTRRPCRSSGELGEVASRATRRAAWPGPRGGCRRRCSRGRGRSARRRKRGRRARDVASARAARRSSAHCDRRRSVHGPIGLPIHGSCRAPTRPASPGTPGPTVACRRSSRPAGSRCWGRASRPRAATTVSMLMHPVVEQVGLHDAAPVDGGAVAQLDEVGLGQPVGLAPHAAPDPSRRGSAARR